MRRIIQSTVVAAIGLLVAALPLAGQGFGRAVAVDGEQILVLRPGSISGPAAVLVYERGPEGWTETQSLSADATLATGEGLGPGLVARGGLAMIAGADPDVRTAAHLFERQPDGRWTAAGRIPLDPAAESIAETDRRLDREGLFNILSPPSRTLSTDGARVLVGSVQGSGAGRARLLERDGESGSWRVAADLIPTSGDDSGGYGSTVLLTPDHAFVGAPRQDEGGGVVYVYESRTDGWTETARIDGTIVGEARRLGSAIGLHGDVLLLGAPGAGDDAGQVILLRRNGDGDWEEVERAHAPVSVEEQAGDRFGASIEVASGMAYVGAPGGGGVYALAHEGGGPTSGWSAGSLPSDAAAASLGADVAADGRYVVAGAPSAEGGVGRVVVWEGPAGTGAPAGTVVEPVDRLATVVGGAVRCADGEAAGFPCRDVDLLSFLTIESLGGAPGETVSDMWGWTDPETGTEYALVGRTGGLVVVDLGSPATPTVVATVAANPSSARDIKTYANHAFFTGDGAGRHGLVVLDLTRLRDIDPAGMPASLAPDAVYDGIASAHNLAIDPASGFAYVVRPSQGGETCGGGLHMVDIRVPTEPTFAGCFTDSAGVLSPGSSHDAQCVVYDGPDREYTGRQICFASNESLLRVVDVTDKENPVPISSASFPAQAYIHQGWLTEDHAWFYLDDELDELVGTTERTRTLVWDLQDLDDPTFAGELLGPDAATDHNLFIEGDRMYQANYQAGLRVVDISDPTAPVEVGHFDTTPYGGNPPGFGGAWTAYPFFESGTVVVSSIAEGLFVLRPVRPLVP